MPEIAFVEAEVPESTRERKPNPFAPTVKALAETRKAKAFTLPVKTDAQRKELAKTVEMIQRAGKDFNVTIRKSVTEDKGTATVTVWAVDRITRERKNSDNAEK